VKPVGCCVEEKPAGPCADAPGAGHHKPLAAALPLIMHDGLQKGFKKVFRRTATARSGRWQGRADGALQCRRHILRSAPLAHLPPGKKPLWHGGNGAAAKGRRLRKGYRGLDGLGAVAKQLCNWMGWGMGGKLRVRLPCTNIWYAMPACPTSREHDE
jgi:hypothetical protein